MSAPPLEVVVALIEREGRCFLQRRALESRRFPGLWEFPGGKVEPGESPRQALLRELMEELCWTPERLDPLPILEHAYPDLRVIIHPFRCLGEGTMHTELPWAWFRPGTIAALPLPEATRTLASRLGA